MAYIYILLFTICLCLIHTLHGVTGMDTTEPQCYSRFDYEFKVVKKLANLEKAVEHQQKQLEALQTTVETSSGPQIAFTATMSKDQSGVGHYSTFKFDVVITNIGESYNPTSGVFTCKVAGVYIFYWVTTNKDRTYMNTELKVNGEKKGTAMSDSGDIRDYSVASNCVVVQLKLGDQAWIESGTWHNGKMAGEWRSSFSGWLMYGQ